MICWRCASVPEAEPDLELMVNSPPFCCCCCWPPAAAAAPCCGSGFAAVNSLICCSHFCTIGWPTAEPPGKHMSSILTRVLVGARNSPSSFARGMWSYTYFTLNVQLHSPSSATHAAGSVGDSVSNKQVQAGLQHTTDVQRQRQQGTETLSCATHDADRRLPYHPDALANKAVTH